MRSNKRLRSNTTNKEPIQESNLISSKRIDLDDTYDVLAGINFDKKTII